jgi:hypothetical protein
LAVTSTEGVPAGSESVVLSEFLDAAWLHAQVTGLRTELAQAHQDLALARRERDEARTALSWIDALDALDVLADDDDGAWQT